MLFRSAIAIQATANDISVSVRDNGRGGDASAFEAADAYGVMGMRERAGHFGGTLRISSTPGRGTCVRLTMPMPAAESSEVGR